MRFTGVFQRLGDQVRFVAQRERHHRLDVQDEPGPIRRADPVFPAMLNRSPGMKIRRHFTAASAAAIKWPCARAERRWCLRVDPVAFDVKP
jgi:hypothetical protein